MKVGLISDVHANLPALEAGFEEMPAVDRLVCAGDVVETTPGRPSASNWSVSSAIPWSLATTIAPSNTQFTTRPTRWLKRASNSTNGS